MILVAGSTGQLGSELVKVLGKRGAGVTHQEMNICKTGQVRDVLTAWMPEWVINCAAATNVDDCEIEKEHAFNVNVRGAFNLANQCSVLKCGLVQISTDFVFGDNGPYKEDDLPTPLNTYGATKLASEIIAIAANPKTVIVRTASLFGIEGCSGKGRTNFVEKVLNAKGPMNVVNDIFMSPTYAAVLAEKIVEMLYIVKPGIYHVAGDGVTNWFDFACEIKKQAKVGIDIKPVSHKGTYARRPLNTGLIDTKLKDSVGSLKPWQEGLATYLSERSKK